MVMSKTTWPSIDEVAIMLMDAVRLLGVKTTSKRLAVNSEFSWHAASELERRTYSALAGRTTAASEERRSSGLRDGMRILTGTSARSRGPGAVMDRVIRSAGARSGMTNLGVTRVNRLIKPACSKRRATAGLVVGGGPEGQTASSRFERGPVATTAEGSRGRSGRRVQSKGPNVQTLRCLSSVGLAAGWVKGRGGGGEDGNERRLPTIVFKSSVPCPRSDCASDGATLRRRGQRRHKSILDVFGVERAKSIKNDCRGPGVRITTACSNENRDLVFEGSGGVLALGQGRKTGDIGLGQHETQDRIGTGTNGRGCVRCCADTDRPLWFTCVAVFCTQVTNSSS